MGVDFCFGPILEADPMMIGSLCNVSGVSFQQRALVLPPALSQEVLRSERLLQVHKQD